MVLEILWCRLNRAKRLELRKILRDLFRSAFSSSNYKALHVEPESAAQGSGRVRLANRIDGFTVLGREHSHIDQFDNLLVLTNFSHHHPGVKVANQDDWSVLPGYDALRCRYIISYRIMGFCATTTGRPLAWSSGITLDQHDAAAQAP